MPWGQTLSAEAREDVDALVNEGLATARAALDKAVNFDPIPFVIGVVGSARRLAYDRRKLGSADPDTIAKSAMQLLLDRAAESRAVALVTVTHLVRFRADAIEVWVEHRDGEALTVLQPFTRNAVGRPSYDEFRAFSASTYVWAG